MPIPPDPAATTGLPFDIDGAVLPFLRDTSAALADAEPPRRPPPTFVNAIDELSEVRAMVGLTSLAAEGLPAPHAGEFGAMLEMLHKKLGDVLTTLGRGQGPSAPAPAEA